MTGGTGGLSRGFVKRFTCLDRQAFQALQDGFDGMRLLRHRHERRRRIKVEGEHGLRRTAQHFLYGSPRLVDDRTVPRRMRQRAIVWQTARSSGAAAISRAFSIRIYPAI
jgi:hypothetical protein